MKSGDVVAELAERQTVVKSLSGTAAQLFAPVCHCH